MKQVKQMRAGVRDIAETLQEFVAFLWVRRLWWLTPLIVCLLLFAMLLFVAQATPAGPFIYTLF